ncbi:MAG TPA: hypothetical protein VK116_11640, partial [Planctomycetota bacterium]|nr:hypothetical protein [Planctomycetota bacterium]
SFNVTDETGNAWLPDDHAGRFSNVELTAAYTRTMRVAQNVADLTLTGGAVAYILTSGQGRIIPNVRDERTSTTELFAAADVGLFQRELWGFSPHLSVHYDPDEADGVYLQGGVRSQRYKIWRELTFGVDFAIAYSDNGHSLWTYGLDESGFADFRGTGSLAYAFNANTVGFLGVSGSVIIDGDLQDWFDVIGIDSENVWVHGGMEFTF